jgi:hypothetical protein
MPLKMIFKSLIRNEGTVALVRSFPITYVIKRKKIKFFTKKLFRNIVYLKENKNKSFFFQLFLNR